MSVHILPNHVVLLKDHELDALQRVAEDPNPVTGVLDWIPRRVTQRKRDDTQIGFLHSPRQCL